MVLQDGPSKRRRNSGGKETPQILSYSTSPKPWLSRRPGPARSTSCRGRRRCRSRRAGTGRSCTPRPPGRGSTPAPTHFEKPSAVQTPASVMPMMSQDGPSKRRRTPSGKQTSQILPYSTSPMPWLLPTVRVSTERIMLRPSTMPRGAATTRAAQKRVEPTRPLNCAPRRGGPAGPRRRHSRLAKPPAAAFSLAVTRPGMLLHLRQRQGAV